MVVAIKLHSFLHCLNHRAPVVDNSGHVNNLSEQIHLPLLTATLVHQHKPGIVVVVWANFVNAAEPEIQHANTPNELLVLEIIEEVLPVIGFTLSQTES